MFQTKTPAFNLPTNDYGMPFLTGVFGAGDKQPWSTSTTVIFNDILSFLYDFVAEQTVGHDGDCGKREPTVIFFFFFLLLL